MRIAIVNHHRNLIGGVESYLSQLLPALQDYGHQVAFWSDDQADPGRPQISIPFGMPSWSVAESGEQSALAALVDWQPDVIFAHGLRLPDLEKRIQRIAPAVFFAHAYYGVCISGAKTFRHPNVKVCDRRFGWQCFLHYYPRRCGGLNPVTMVREYERQADRLALLANYRAIAVASEHMADEYRKYGLGHLVKVVGLPINPLAEMASANRQLQGEWRLLFLGRMDELKGGDVFLESLPLAQFESGKRLHITFAGDGPMKEQWRQKSVKLTNDHPGLKFEFTGWVTAEQRSALFQRTDLLVVPSLWPEPFGLVGLEAGQYGVPAVAFRVGGIESWLDDGINGLWVNPEGRREQNLGRAIIRCLKDPDFYNQMARGAAEQASKFSLDAHVRNLMPLLENAINPQPIRHPLNQELFQSQ
ncbi:MAG: glycosyltransferase family 4 protein [Blastocatellales bacterium]